MDKIVGDKWNNTRFEQVLHASYNDKKITSYVDMILKLPRADIEKFVVQLNDQIGVAALIGELLAEKIEDTRAGAK